VLRRSFSSDVPFCIGYPEPTKSFRCPRNRTAPSAGGPQHRAGQALAALCLGGSVITARSARAARCDMHYSRASMLNQRVECCAVFSISDSHLNCRMWRAGHTGLKAGLCLPYFSTSQYAGAHSRYPLTIWASYRPRLSWRTKSPREAGLAQNLPADPEQPNLNDGRRARPVRNRPALSLTRTILFGLFHHRITANRHPHPLEIASG